MTFLVEGEQVSPVVDGNITVAGPRTGSCCRNLELRCFHQSAVENNIAGIKYEMTC